MRYRSTRGAVFSEKYHVIWCPKYRSKVIGARVEARLIEVETMPDHVHLRVEVPPKVAVAQLVKVLKGRSSRLLRWEFPHLARMKYLWSPSYFVSTVGGAPLEVVRRYVENQKLADARKRTKAA